MIRVRNERVVAVAAVVERPDGSRTIIGSREILEMSLSVNVGVEDPITYELSATMASVQFHHAEPLNVSPLALPVRGIYLPGMAFRALPVPGEGTPDA